MNQLETPLIEALKEYCSKNKVGFHVPAHRQGKALPREMLQQEKFFQWDLTEVPGLDDLHNPRQAIARAQRLAADLYQSRECYFIINGTSAGLVALILATCGPGDVLVMPRNVHRSVLTGLILSGARPVYLYPPLLDEFGIPSILAPEKLNRCLEKYPAAAVLMVHPSYYGIAEKIAPMAEITHRYGIPLLVDEAHGAHFRFHSELPADALSGGADAVVQSTHKVGGALTQASMLHLNSHRVDKMRLEECLRMVQSTSPSYILMASLDAARRQLAAEGSVLIDKSLRVARKLRQKISALPGVKVLSPHHLNDCDILLIDETRLVINVQETGLTGFQAAEILSDNYGVQVEMADYYNIVVLLGLNAGEQDGRALYQALFKLVTENKGNSSAVFSAPQPPRVVQAVTPRQAWLSKVKVISLEEAAGKISADSVAVYPPGVPALCPGEIVSEEMIDYLLEVRKRKLHVQCSGDVTLNTIRVLNI
ncbi:arginine/lysine/ornithine decarboxylase [Desulfohalotomaculum tongense]|uniref:aminotransferase class I/II-fold pyridoxal phosphate-dependent enzyme n=1 Tax=Desulforadius tongensis TaxID=1216062 RepID=UPI00195B2E66|nr:aminotransferase class I/II-fold pyridoxal phosphate-dependent enzyme [Desulforadius tongensis]MBM7855168.1 arginine/lysine/ornithine decarboxylase [Desulforadius tongensis]